MISDFSQFFVHVSCHHTAPFWVEAATIFIFFVIDGMGGDESEKNRLADTMAKHVSCFVSCFDMFYP
jgi:hypothetical protein